MAFTARNMMVTTNMHDFRKGLYRCMEDHRKFMNLDVLSISGKWKCGISLPITPKAIIHGSIMWKNISSVFLATTTYWFMLPLKNVIPARKSLQFLVVSLPIINTFYCERKLNYALYYATVELLCRVEVFGLPPITFICCVFELCFSP